MMKATTLCLLAMLCAARATLIVELDPAFLARAAATGAEAPRVAMEPDMVALVERTDTWTRGERAGAEEMMLVHLMMAHEESAVAALESALFAVSDPRSPRYGQHLSLEQLAEMTPIADAALDTTKAFLAHAGVASIEVNPNRDILAVTLSVAAAEELFATTIHAYHHASIEGVSVLRAVAAYSLPKAVAEVVSVVADLVALPAFRAPIKSEVAVSLRGEAAGDWPKGCPDLASCDALTTPAVIRQAYKITDPSPNTHTTSSMAVAEFQGQYFKKADLAKFSTGCAVNVTVDHVVGGDEQSAGVEAELDIEYIKALAPEVPLTVIYSSTFSLLNWVNSITKMSSPPLVHSVSYGNDEKQQTSKAYMQSVNTQFMKAGARGLSILFASGDQGVCGREGCGLFRKRFKPDFPGGSPYVTAVGGTNFVDKSTIGAETAWNGSGGGFSDNFAIPAWQADALKAYKANPDADLPAQSMWNNTGRGYPDVAALGGETNSYCVVTNGMASGVAGTSAACPVVAAVFAKLNGLRLAAGKQPLGFLNPFIYQNGAQGFNDVTSGKNTGGGLLNRQGFTATKGWDPASGWGSPNFEELAKLVVQ